MVGSCTKAFSRAALAALTAAAVVGPAFADNSVNINPGPTARSVDPLAWDGDIPSPFAIPRVGVRGDAGQQECMTALGNCQTWDRDVGTAGRSADLVPIAALAGDDFKVADNFTSASGGVLTNICFWGFYNSTTALAAGVAPTATTEAFRIRILGNTGAPNSGIPNDANVIAEYVVGPSTATPGYTLSLTPGTTFMRLPQVGNTMPVARGNTIGYSVGLPAPGLTINAGQCYWIEIVGATDGIAEANRFRWAVSNSINPASSDNVFYQGVHSFPYDYVDLIGNAGDMAFCLNFALDANGGCNIPPAPSNQTCATAQVITPGFSATGLSTLRSATAATPFCGFNPVNGNTLWYRVTGNGNTFTASTCGAGTNFDTVINVYCSLDGTCGTSNANLLCVANNDTSDPACGSTTADTSTVSWPTESGRDYLVAVFGFELAAGFLDFSLTSDMTPVTAPTCASDRCPLDNTGISGEVDACGVSNNSACNGTSVGNFVLGTAFAGTSYNLGTSRDFDFWELSGGSVPDNTCGSGLSWVDVSYQVEFPGIFNFFEGPCNAPTSNGTFIGGAFANYLDGGPACPRDPNVIQVQVTTGGAFRLNLLPVDFGGVTCASGENDYRITVSLSATGACCVPATACFCTVELDCVDQGGTYFGNGSTCSPADDCAAFGACCTPDGLCSFALNAAACPGTFNLGVACSPGLCPAPSTGACCCGSSCTITSAAACTGANRLFAGPGSSCTPFSNTTPCCRGDYNKTGAPATVQDIFDFLAGYFSNDACADTNDSGGAPSVQDIFDFLAAYFGGGC